MTIYIVRHGQTAWNKTLRWQGNQDVPLDETGISQTHKLAEELLLYRVNKVYSSPLKRAAMSAEILREKIDADIIYREGLREVHLGEWEGLTTKEIIEKHGKLYGEWIENPSAQIGFGVENISDLQQRAYREFCAINAAEKGDFVIVAHGTWTRCLLCRLLNTPLISRMNFEVSNAGINIIACDGNRDTPHFTVTTLNDISHLA